MASTIGVCSNLKISFVLQKYATNPKIHTAVPENLHKISQANDEIPVTSPSQVVRSGNRSARHRRLSVKRQKSSFDAAAQQLRMTSNSNKWRNSACLAEDSLSQNRNGIIVGNKELVSPNCDIRLFMNIRAGVHLEDCKKRLQENLGYEPSYIQLASYMNISREDLATKLFGYSMAIDKLVKANIRLVISVARKYKNMGIDIADLTQVGLLGLVRGLKKFDYTKGVKLSTFVHWWIRQRITMTLGISDPKLEKLLKVRNKTISLDRNIYTTINREPCGVVQDYIMDSNIDNQPWYTVSSDILKEDINNLIKSSLDNRERIILRLYFGLDACSCTWEAIGKRLGLSRERVRQVGLKAIQKLKNAAIHHKLIPLSMQ